MSSKWTDLLGAPKTALFDEFSAASDSSKLAAEAMMRVCLLAPYEPYPNIVSFESSNEGQLTIEDLDKIIEDLGLRKVLNKSSASFYSRIFVNDDNTCLCDTYFNKEEKGFEVSIISIDRSWDEKIENLQKLFTTNKDDINEVFVLISSREGMQLESIGSIAEPLTRENYSEEVLADYDFIVANVGAKKPKGRLSILNGPPGTGKTHLIKGLIHEMEANCNFIVVSPDMVTQLTGPSFIKSLIDLKDPIVLILEDADQCLTRKARENMSEIQTVLNFADGIVGQLLDLRLVVTSNVDTQDFDKAILRPGRLCRHVELGPLGKEEANKLFASLGGEGEPFKAQATLAEVYGALSGVIEEVKETRKLGF